MQDDAIRIYTGKCQLGSKRMDAPAVSIIILNYNGWKESVECLESIYQLDYTDFDVVFVDNGSTDGSIESIRDYAGGAMRVASDFVKYSEFNKPIRIFEYNWNKSKTEEDIDTSNNIAILNGRNYDHRLILIKNDENVGFAQGNNIGINFAINNLNPRYLLLLNNDTVVDSQFLNRLVDAGERRSTIGVLGPVVCHYYDRDMVQSAGATVQWSIGSQTIFFANRGVDELPNDPMSVGYVSGCALLAKKEVFDRIGLLNSGYFAYWEETEWCDRARRSGYDIVIIPESRIWHKGGVTASKFNNLAEYLMTRNMFWCIKQHSSSAEFRSFVVFFFKSTFWRKSLDLLYYKNISAFISYVRGIKDGLGGQPPPSMTMK